MPGDIRSFDMAQDRFCRRCGHKLSEKKIDNKIRPHCASCGFVVYLDPKIAAVVLVSDGGRLVLVRRGIEPAMGRWSFPSGYVDRGEAIEDAAVREVKEETGLDVKLGGLIGLYSRSGSPVALAVFSARVVGGRLEAGSEAQDAAWFSADDLPPLPFPHDEQILKDWKTLNANNRP